MADQEYYISAFGHKVPAKRVQVKADTRTIKQFGVEVDKNTGDTNIVITGELDLVELIQSYKDSCGLEYCQKLIKQGLVSEDAFADDGRHSVDASYPTDIGTLYQMSGVDLVKAFGITADMTSDEITKAITDKLAAAAQAQAQTQTEKKDGE